MKNNLILGLIVLGIGLILAALFIPRESSIQSNSRLIAITSQKTGSVVIESADQSSSALLTKKTEINDLDTIRTENQSSALIEILPYKTDLKIFENSTVLFEKTKDKSIIITIKEGRLEIEDLGDVSNDHSSESTFWIVKEGRKLSAIDYYLSFTNSSKNQNLNVLNETMSKQNPKHQLTQAKIEEILNSKKNDYFRCYSQLIQKDEPMNSKVSDKLYGQVLVSFDITSEGRAKKIEIYKTDISSQSFLSCLKEIILRTKFPPFSGPTITTVFPISFD